MLTSTYKRISIALVLVACFFAADPAQAQKIKIQKATPAWAEQGTGTEAEPLEVLIDGEGLSDVSSVRFLVAGTRNNAGGVSVKWIVAGNDKQVKAYITVAEDAVTDYFDIELTTLRGRRGKGNTLFQVVEKDGVPFSGESISLDCQLKSAPGDTVNSDGLPGLDGEGTYMDAEEKVGCSTGGTTQPNLSGLSLISLAKGKRVHRKIDLNLRNFIAFHYDPSAKTYELLDGADPAAAGLPPGIFESADGNVFSMEDVQVGVRPYTAFQDHIQLLTPGSQYEMALRLRVIGNNRIKISLANTYVTDHFNFEGLLCAASYALNPYRNGGDDTFNGNDIAAGSEDVTVYLWPDSDGDFVADGFTVTTGAIASVPPVGGYSLADPPTTTDAPRISAICSADGPLVCGGADNSEPCNFLGFAEVQFTWHAESR